MAGISESEATSDAVDCPYWSRVPPTEGEDSEFGACGLAAEVLGLAAASGVDDPELLKVSRAACDCCRTLFPPTPESPNAMAASVIHVVGERILARGGVDGCDAESAGERMRWASKFLPVLSAGPDPGSAAWEPYQGGCFYLGEHRGDRQCAGCRGSVRQKVFACRHERHEETMIEECRRCPDYDRALSLGEVSTWAVGMVAAPRATPTLDRSLDSLIAAGWTEGMIFAEPGTTRPPLPPSYPWVERVLPLGAWSNWLLALEELALRYPRADAFLICQDDVVYAPGLRDYLERTLWPSSPVGVASLHVASHQDAGRGRAGWFASDLGWQAWGAQAYVFPNAALRSFLRDSRVRNHRHRGPGLGAQSIDSVVGLWCRSSGLPYLLHSPSPTQHIGAASAIWDAGGVEGRRRAATFPGEKCDFLEAMGLADSEDADAPPEFAVSPAPHGPDTPAGRRRAVAEEPDRLDDPWQNARFVVGAPLVGRVGPFDRWRDWLLSGRLPPRVDLRLVDNRRRVGTEDEHGEDAAAASGDHFGGLLRDAVAAFRGSGRFGDVAVLRGKGAAPESDGERFTLAKHESVAGAYNLAFRDAPADLALILDCDVVPPPDGLFLLVDAFRRLRRQGVRVGAVSGCCESAAARGKLAACRSHVDWRRRIGVDELGDDELVEIGLVGAAFLLVDNRLLQEILPLRAVHMSRIAGPDSYLCQELRRRGHGVWLHGGVRCEHVIDESTPAPAAAPEVTA